MGNGRRYLPEAARTARRSGFRYVTDALGELALGLLRQRRIGHDRRYGYPVSLPFFAEAGPAVAGLFVIGAG